MFRKPSLFLIGGYEFAARLTKWQDCNCFRGCVLGLLCTRAERYRHAVGPSE